MTAPPPILSSPFSLRPHPHLYEINTWAWLEELSARLGRLIKLADVPDSEWDIIAQRGFDITWLMGVWQRSAEARRIALLPSNTGSYARALPGWKADDVVGSPLFRRAIHSRSAHRRLGTISIAFAKSFAREGSRFSSISSAITRPSITHGCASIPSFTSRGPSTILKRIPQVSSASKRRKAPPLSRLAAIRTSPLDGYGASQPLQSGIARRSDQPARHHRRALRRHSLRHGDAATQRHFRESLGSLARRVKTTGEGVLGGSTCGGAESDSPRGSIFGAPKHDSCISASNSRTTKKSTTQFGASMSAKYAGSSLRRLRTRVISRVSSKTTTSLAPPSLSASSACKRLAH